MKLSDISTYQAAVYQSRAHRVVRNRIGSLLKKHGLTMTQWSVLGYVHDAGEQGIRISDLARKIDTSLAFVTNSVNTLESKGMVYRLGHAQDNRAKLVRVSQEFAPKIEQIERYMRDELCGWIINRIGQDALQTYLDVLKSIATAEETI